MFKKPFVAQERNSFETKGESLTKQDQMSMCDVNNIIAQYDRTGLIRHINESVAQYGDFTQVNEYQESLNFVMQAQDNFNALPSDLRSKFNNDPGAFFEFVTDPANIDEMVKLGLAVAPEPREEVAPQGEEDASASE